MGWNFCFPKKAHPKESAALHPTPRLFSQPISTPPLEIASTTSIDLNSTAETSIRTSPKEANILLVQELSNLKKEGEIKTKPQPEPRRLHSLATSIPPIPPKSIELVPPTPIEAPSSSSADNTNTYFSTIPSTTEEETTLPLSNPSNSSQTSSDPRVSHTRNDSLSTPPLTALQHPKHRRSSSGGGSIHKFKETLNAFEYDEGEGGTRTINQYVLKGEIGHGSYASVERATDRETGIDYVGIHSFFCFLLSFFVVFFFLVEIADIFYIFYRLSRNSRKVN